MGTSLKLSIVIPAYNEEEAIASIIERTLAAREHITRESPVGEVEVIVVSDGSIDRTVEIARRYEGIQLIVFEKNRGYGAAIKKGFEVSEGGLVGFLDADGTCDPRFFADLCRAISEDDAAVAIGSRLSPQSRMPGVRRLGNRVYALILSALSNKVVTDTASGMRVIRRDALHQLYPLPDGLHFTPAMSARVLMDERLRIVERPMAYEERMGESKLHVLKDGVRFLRTIVEMSFMCRPGKFLCAAAAICLGIALLMTLHPFETWLRIGRLQEDVIYRLLTASFLGAFAAALLSAGVISDNLDRLTKEDAAERTFRSHVLDRFYSLHGLLCVAALAIPLIARLAGEGVWTRLTGGYVAIHWSRVVLAGLIAFVLGQMGVTVLLCNVIRFHINRRLISAFAPHAAMNREAVPIESASRTGLDKKSLDRPLRQRMVAPSASQSREAVLHPFGVQSAASPVSGGATPG
jgi:glycosyltransferase involved in cell wall biosynthesis